jgi:hypothetical protein
MTSLTILPETIRSTSQNLLYRLPSPNQSISESDREPTFSRAWGDLIVSCFQAPQRFSETFSGSPKILRELLQARQIWADKGISTFYFFEAQLQLLELIYSFRKPREVKRFLETYKFLAPLLIEAYFEIGKHFPNPRIFLEIDIDPEETNDQQLVAFVATNYSPNEAIRKLKQFDEDWWLDALDRAQKRLCINVEFE